MMETKYGKEFYRLDFSQAIERELLSDYKVSILAVNEKYVSSVMREDVLLESRELNTSDVVKIIGCWNGLSKRFVKNEKPTEERNKKSSIEKNKKPNDEKLNDEKPMKRAVAFTNTIEHSKFVKEKFQSTVELFKNHNRGAEGILECEVEHVDGTQNSLERNKKINWLKSNIEDNRCHILTNVHCLSEGVDVPALDAVLFLNPRKSEVDIVQSVGRVMRKSEGKKYGYIILPIVVPADVSAEEALESNDNYKTVWQVLQALRSHDNRFDAMINKLELNKKPPENLNIIGVGFGDEQAQEDEVSFDREDQESRMGFGDEQIQEDRVNIEKSKHREVVHLELPSMNVDELRDSFLVKLVQKCGNRFYWEQWSGAVAKVAQTITSRLKDLIENGSQSQKTTFNNFWNDLKNNLNDNITRAEIIEMLSQHMITKPIFRALFRGYDFIQKNPVSEKYGRGYFSV